MGHGPIDIALWDLQAKRPGTSVAELPRRLPDTAADAGPSHYPSEPLRGVDAGPV